MLSDGSSDFQHMLQISTSVFIGRCAHSNELDFGLGDGFGCIRSKLQTAFRKVGFDQRLQTRFKNRNFALA